MHLRLDGSLMSRLIEVPGRAKRDSILSIMADFPLRQFVLVGDSGEIDLEIYTKIALEHPGRILKIFIHDVTTPYALHKQAKKRQSSGDAFARSNSMSLSTLFESDNDTSSPVDTRTNSLLELASSITSSSVLGLGRGRTKTLAELVSESTSPLSASPPSSTASSIYTSSPSQQCIQLYDRIRKAQDQLDTVDVVLFQNAEDLHEDSTIQQALWQQWDDQCPSSVDR
jgi:hypothetical protein